MIAGLGMLPRPKRFASVKLKHRKNVRGGVTNPVPLGAMQTPAPWDMRDAFAF